MEFNYPEGATPLDPDRTKYIESLIAADKDDYELLICALSALRA
jgi:hypothetical protein